MENVTDQKETTIHDSNDTGNTTNTDNNITTNNQNDTVNTPQQRSSGFIQRHPLLFGLIILFTIYTSYSMYLFLYPSTGGLKIAYKPDDIFMVNASIRHNEMNEQIFSEQITYQAVCDSLEHELHIPQQFIGLLQKNESVNMDVSITPLSLYNNKTKIFSSPLLKSFTPLAEKHNLMNEDSIDQNKFKHNFTLATIPYFHISFMNTAIDPSTLPPTHTKDFRINRKHKLFYPMMYHNTFWLIKERYIPMNDTVTDVVVPLQLSTVSYFKWTMMKSFDESFNIHSQMGTLEENETDEFKRIFMETNIVLLVVTMTVTILHSVFDFLAYKNDIQFWNKRDNFAGISIKSVLLSIVIEVIVLLYLLDNDTSFMILISSGIGLLITIWKLTRVFKINFQHDGPLVEYKNKAYEQSNTKLYDDQALKYLGIACIPLCIGYSIYSLYTNEFKSWYSYILSTLVGVVYAFGFLQMTPQLFINYKLKSVANLPWRVFIYKFLNTIVDDLFAFVIKMPTLHRIACFRDDVIFVLYLYQRWIYPVDLNRMDSTHWEDDTPLVKQTKDKED